ncbi:MAG: glycosyltransferase family 2 protein [Patescibacteria group bacterium]
MKLAVGFLTYNESSARYLPDFWPSLQSALSVWGGDYKVLVGDNSESALNPNAVFFNFADPKLEFIWNRANLGFSKGYNRLIARARELEAEYFLVINPDTVLDKEAIKELISALDRDLNLASASPKVLDLHSGRIDTLGLVLKPGLRFADYGQGQEDKGDQPSIIGPSGAAGLFRMSALESIKEKGQYFDERMFMYKEDCDLAYRLFSRGQVSRLVQEAVVYHDRSARVSDPGLLGIIKGRKSKSRQIRQWSFQNQRLIWRKHWSKQNLKNKIIILSLRFLSYLWAIFFERFLFNNRKK